MKTTPLTVASALLLAGLSIGLADETPIQPQIESVGLFKNGVAVVRASFTVPGAGSYRWDNLPQTIHGTFAVDSEAVLTTRATHRLVEEEVKTAAPGMQDALAGKNVTVFLTGENGQAAPALQGRVWEVPAAQSNGNFSTQYPINDRYGRSYGWDGSAMGTGFNPARMDDFLILETATGREYINRQRILSVSAVGPFGPVKHQIEKPVLLFDVSSGSGKVQLTYLARGMAWLPAYTVDISDPTTLTIRQSAVVRNELMDLKETALDLISGYPNIRFSHVDSPLNPDTPLATFFQQLNSQGNSSPATMSQMVSFNSVAPAAANPLPENPEAGPAGSDIHYQPIGKRDLQRGDSLALAIATEKSPYTRIVEWIVPDFRDPNGRRGSSRSNHEAPDPEDQPWDALRFTNPFKFPMTTAPASITEAGRFRGQSLSQWVNPGQAATLRVTQALSIRAQASETEEENARSNPKPENIAWFFGSRYMRLTIKGTLQVHNFRATEVPLHIRCRFAGELIDAEAKPTTTLLNENSGINPRTELAWILPLKPGEEQTLHYRYHLWTAY